MPFYEYRCTTDGCTKKGRIVQEIQNMHDPHIAKCSKCGKMMQRRYSLGGFTIDFSPGFDPGLGEYCNSKRERENFISQKGLRRIKD